MSTVPKCERGKDEETDRSIERSLAAGIDERLVRLSIRQEYHHDHDRRNNQRRGDATQIEATFCKGLRQGVAERCSKGSRQNIGSPEEHAVRNLREVVRCRDNRYQAGEDKCAALEAEARVVGGEIAQRRA